MSRHGEALRSLVTRVRVHMYTYTPARVEPCALSIVPAQAAGKDSPHADRQPLYKLRVFWYSEPLS
jgi:hypothetical protein